MHLCVITLSHSISLLRLVTKFDSFIHNHIIKCFNNGEEDALGLSLNSYKGFVMLTEYKVYTIQLSKK